MLKGFTAVLLGSLLLLGGCSSKNDSKIVEEEMKAVTAIAEAEGTRVLIIKEAHSETLEEIASVPEATSGERLLAIALVGRDFVEVSKSKLGDILANFKRATLGTDVQKEGVKQVGKGIPVMTIGAVAINSDREGTGDSIDAKNSTVNINKEETRATGIGEGSPPTVTNRSPETTEVKETEVSD